MNNLILVSCVSAKQTNPAPACDLYTSDWFRKARAYAERHATNQRWYILSAKHGLTDPATVLAPYDLTLKTMSRAQRTEWANRVYQALSTLADPHQDKIIFLAGSVYREPLATLLLQNHYQLEIPMQGLRIGEQLHWLSSHLN